MVRKAKSNPKLLTEVELELMQILWTLGEGTVLDVQGALSTRRKLAYTSISTMLRILEQKGAVESRKAGRGHVYIPLLSKKVYEGKSVDHLVSRVFDGIPSALVRTLLEDDRLTDEELESIRKLLEERKV